MGKDRRTVIILNDDHSEAEIYTCSENMQSYIENLAITTGQGKLLNVLKGESDSGSAAVKHYSCPGEWIDIDWTDVI